MKEFKTVVLGVAGVGKSAVTVRFVQGLFLEKYDPTVEDSYTKVVSFEDTEYFLEILDTAGTETMSALRDLYMINGEGFILVYSVCEPQTMRDLLDIKDQIERVKEGERPPIIICGNKIDLDADRRVSSAEGEEFTNKSFPNQMHFEVSAKTGKNIETVFHTMITRMSEHQDKKNNKGGKKRDSSKPKEKGEKGGGKGGCQLL